MRIAIGRTGEAPAGVVAEANAQLATLAPRHDVLHWLHCYYEPGDPWHPVERLVIAEVMPRRALVLNQRAVQVTGATLLDELLGPHPRAFARYDAGLGRLVYQDGVLQPAITARQWQLFRELDGFAMPVWIVQGEKGGHPRHYDLADRALLAKHGLPDEPPVIGSLPFARVDRRTIAQLRQRDQLAHWRARTARSWIGRTAADVTREKKVATLLYERTRLQHLMASIEDVVLEDAKAIDLRDLPVLPVEQQVDHAAVLEAQLDPTNADAQREARPRGARILVAT